MAKTLSPSVAPAQGGLSAAFSNWMREEGAWWVSSLAGHAVALGAVALFAGTIQVGKSLLDAPSFDTVVDEDVAESEIKPFELGDVPLEPTELSADTLMADPSTMDQAAEFNDNSDTFAADSGGANGTTSFGGLSGFIEGIGDGPSTAGASGIGASAGNGNNAGAEGHGSGFGERGTGHRKELVGNGGTKGTERSVAGGLNWLARHQNANGS